MNLKFIKLILRYQRKYIKRNRRGKKNDGSPFKVFTPYWRSAEKFYSEKIPSKINKISKCLKTSFLKIL